MPTGATRLPMPFPCKSGGAVDIYNSLQVPGFLSKLFKAMPPLKWGREDCIGTTESPDYPGGLDGEAGLTIPGRTLLPPCTQPQTCTRLHTSAWQCPCRKKRKDLRAMKQNFGCFSACLDNLSCPYDSICSLIPLHRHPQSLRSCFVKASHRRQTVII